MRAADGQTPLGVALSAGRRDLADWLDWRGWALPQRALRDEDLPAAAMAGDTDAVRRLLDLGFPVDATDDKGCSALLRAAGGGHAAALELLLARGADPQRPAHTGATPLSAAVSMRHGDIVERLLAAKVPLEQRLPGDVTVLMLAAALGLPDICARLLTAGANVQAADAQGLTPLHCAALHGFTSRDRPRLLALFDTLLLAGAEPDCEAAGGVTPLLLLLGARAEPGTAATRTWSSRVDRLLDRTPPRRPGPARLRPAAPDRPARTAAPCPPPAARRLRPGPARCPQPQPAGDRGDARFRRRGRGIRAARRGRLDGPVLRDRG